MTNAPFYENNNISPEYITLESLAPEYNPDKHKKYLTLLESAITKEDIKNIALSGIYGSGKSSILSEFNKKYRQHSVSISLPHFEKHSELNNQSPATSQNHDKDTATLQKEILKQLLYSKKPHELSDSKFLRTRKPNTWEKLLSSLTMPFLCWFIIYKSGFLNDFSTFTDHRLDRMGFIFAITFFTALFIIFYKYPIKFSNIRLSSVKTQGLEFSSHNKEYFDENLDEIIYFFDKTGVKYVIFEDLDRFDNLEIFEDLRNLNTIINNSNSKNIIFIYAVKESLFADKNSGALNDKFFDIVIPVVHFAGNSIKYYNEIVSILAMKNSIDRQLLSIIRKFFKSHRHLLILNNNFQMHRELLSERKWYLPTSNQEHELLGMMIFKTLQPSEFEKSLTGLSQIDKFSKIISDLIVEINKDFQQNKKNSYYGHYIFNQSLNEQIGKSWDWYISDSYLKKLDEYKSLGSADKFKLLRDKIVTFKNENPLLAELIEHGYISENYILFTTLFETTLDEPKSVEFLYVHNEVEIISKYNLPETDLDKIWDETNGFIDYNNHVYNVKILKFIMEQHPDEAPRINRYIFNEIHILASKIHNFLSDPEESEEFYYEAPDNSFMYQFISESFKSSKIGKLLSYTDSIEDQKIVYTFLVKFRKSLSDYDSLYSLFYLYESFLLSKLNINNETSKVDINTLSYSSLPYLNLKKFHRDLREFNILEKFEKIDYSFNGSEEPLDKNDVLFTWEKNN